MVVLKIVSRVHLQTSNTLDVSLAVIAMSRRALGDGVNTSEEVLRKLQSMVILLQLPIKKKKQS